MGWHETIHRFQLNQKGAGDDEICAVIADNNPAIADRQLHFCCHVETGVPQCNRHRTQVHGLQESVPKFPVDVEERTDHTGGEPVTPWINNVPGWVSG